jgi:autophagy-related protein 101
VADQLQIAVLLQQKRPKKTWFTVTEEIVPWEEHLFTVHLSPRPVPDALPEALIQLLTFCSERTAHVPALVQAGVSTALSSIVH